MSRCKAVTFLSEAYGWSWVGGVTRWWAAVQALTHSCKVDTRQKLRNVPLFTSSQAEGNGWRGNTQLSHFPCSLIVSMAMRKAVVFSFDLVSQLCPGMFPISLFVDLWLPNYWRTVYKLPVMWWKQAPPPATCDENRPRPMTQSSPAPISSNVTETTRSTLVQSDWDLLPIHSYVERISFLCFVQNSVWTLTPEIGFGFGRGS